MVTEPTPVANVTGQYCEMHREGRTTPVANVTGLYKELHHGN